MCPYYLDGDLAQRDLMRLLASRRSSIMQGPVIPVFQPPLIDGG